MGSLFVETIRTLVGFREVVVEIRTIERLREQGFKMRGECSMHVRDLLMDELGPRRFPAKRMFISLLSIILRR